MVLQPQIFVQSHSDEMASCPWCRPTSGKLVSPAAAAFPLQLETIKDISLDAAKIQHYLRFVQRSNVTKRHLQWPVRGTSWLVLKHGLLVGLVGNSFPDWASRNRRLVGKNSPGEKEAH